MIVVVNSLLFPNNSTPHGRADNPKIMLRWLGRRGVQKGRVEEMVMKRQVGRREARCKEAGTWKTAAENSSFHEG